MKKVLFLISLLSFAALSCTIHDDDTGTTDSAVVIRAASIPETRSTVKSQPAAEYSEAIDDRLNKWKFIVALYETQRTFDYAIRVQSKELRVSDSIHIPNFGIEPKVEIHKGKEPLTCIIGFLDKKNVFQEYREVSFRDNRLRMKTLHTYSVGSYRTKAKQ